MYLGTKVHIRQRLPALQVGVLCGPSPGIALPADSQYLGAVWLPSAVGLRDATEIHSNAFAGRDGDLGRDQHQTQSSRPL